MMINIYTYIPELLERTAELEKREDTIWYSYIDVDQDASTGYPPTRDDNCYFGIPIGDDSEAQFEFVGNRFVKTFLGLQVLEQRRKC